MTTRIEYVLFSRSPNCKPFLAVNTYILADGWKLVHQESHIEEMNTEYDRILVWRKWRAFLQCGEPIKLTKGNAFGKYVRAVREWEA